MKTSLYRNDNGEDKSGRQTYNKPLSNYHQIDEYRTVAHLCLSTRLY